MEPSETTRTPVPCLTLTPLPAPGTRRCNPQRVPSAFWCVAWAPLPSPLRSPKAVADGQLRRPAAQQKKTRGPIVFQRPAPLVDKLLEAGYDAGGHPLVPRGKGAEAWVMPVHTLLGGPGTLGLHHLSVYAYGKEEHRPGPSHAACRGHLWIDAHQFQDQEAVLCDYPRAETHRRGLFRVVPCVPWVCVVCVRVGSVCILLYIS